MFKLKMKLTFAIKAKFYKCFLNSYKLIKLNKKGALYKLYTLYNSICI